MKKLTRPYEYLGWVIEQGVAGWYVCDWDYEGETDLYYGPFSSQSEAEYQARRLS